MPKLLQPSFQEECAEVREGKDPVGKAYISGRELDTALDVGVLFIAYQSKKGLGTIVFRCCSIEIRGSGFAAA